MKSAVYLLCIIGLIACKGKPATVRTDSSITDSTALAKSVKNTVSDSTRHDSIAATAQVPPKPVIAFSALPDDYSIIDTGKYTTGIMNGSYVIVKNTDGLIDTIDRGFGIQDVNNNERIYLKLTHSPDGEYDDPAGKKHRFLTLYDEYLMLIKDKKTSLKKVLPGFDEFSSPNVINNKIYYWRINRQASSLYKIMAVEYDPETKRTQSHFLFNDGVETDDTGYFSAPYLEGDTIHYYRSDKQKWKFSPSFKLYK